jgi:hypothetical protein
MLRRFHPVLTCAAWLTATAAMGQTAPSASTPDRPTPVASAGNVGRQTFDFVRAYAASTPKIDQIPRWQDPLCVQVIGLPADQAAQVKARVEDVAKAVGVSAAPAGCAANVEIVFTAEPQRLVDDLTKGREWLLGYYYHDAIARTVTRPVQAWYVTATASGVASNANTAFAFLPNTAVGAGLPTQTWKRVMDLPEFWSPTGCANSPFTSCLQSLLTNALVVVDTGRVGGKSVGLLSDYVAMVVLSQPRSLDSCQPLPSVTDLFASGCSGRAAPDGLTPADAAYLTALYQANPEARKAGEQADIAGRMAKILGPAGVAAR